MCAFQEAILILLPGDVLSAFCGFGIVFLFPPPEEQQLLLEVTALLVTRCAH